MIELQIEDKNFINVFNHKSDKDYNHNSDEIILKSKNDINYSNSNIDRKNSIKLRTDQHNNKVKKKRRC